MNEEAHQRDLARRREARRRRRAADPEKYRAKDREQKRKTVAKYGQPVLTEAQRKRKNERTSQWRKANRDKVNEYRRTGRQRKKEADPKKLSEQESLRFQRRRAAGYRQPYKPPQTPRWDNLEYRDRQRAAHKRFTHGPDYEAAYKAMWDAQGGRCYLCLKPLVPGRNTHVEHDHSCCGPAKTCPFCRRGLACSRCNTTIGMAEDNPDLLRLIADNQEAVLGPTRARIAAKPQQDALWSEAG